MRQTYTVYYESPEKPETGEYLDRLFGSLYTGQLRLS